ncbi:MAG: hypothetical protein LBG80_08295 [Bacteroidales bacterium]|jgi:hypothetical protein|nr:hypothetical protein [Bacteroidales bacterium]
MSNNHVYIEPVYKVGITPSLRAQRSARKSSGGNPHPTTRFNAVIAGQAHNDDIIWTILMITPTTRLRQKVAGQARNDGVVWTMLMITPTMHFKAEIAGQACNDGVVWTA